MYFLLMGTTGLVEIVNITGLSLCRRGGRCYSYMYIGMHGVCALESSSYVLMRLIKIVQVIVIVMNQIPVHSAIYPNFTQPHYHRLT